MRHLRPTVLAALVVALCAAPAAGADAPRKAVLTPSTGPLLGEATAQTYGLPLSENPFAGNGNPCLTVGHNVIWAVGSAPHCTVKQGTAILLVVGTAWSSAEDPFPKDEAAQRALALAADQATSEIQVTIDDADPVDIHTRRFERFSPQRTIQLPDENILGVPAQTVTATTHAWSALVRNLRRGHHTISGEAVIDGEQFVETSSIDVVPTHSP